MTALKFHKVTTLPGTLDGNALYFVQNGTFSETYVTNSAGVARAIGNSVMIQSIADARIALAMADLDVVQIVADITARNALTLTRNAMVLVLDATGDSTVASGAALYAFRESTTSWIKLAEYESMDVTLTWGAISGRPTSAVSLIDDAVTKRHTHANLAVLDDLGDAAGALTYGGDPVGASWSTLNW